MGIALSPQNSASPGSATSAMTWLLRSIDQSLRASAARSACAAGIITEPGSRAALASVCDLQGAPDRAGTRTARRSGLRTRCPGPARTRARRPPVPPWVPAAPGAPRPGVAAALQSLRPAAARAPRSGSKAILLLLERLGDLVDRVVLLAQRHRQIARFGFLRLLARPWAGRSKELRDRGRGGTDGTARETSPGYSRSRAPPRATGVLRGSRRATPRTCAGAGGTAASKKRRHSVMSFGAPIPTYAQCHIQPMVVKRLRLPPSLVGWETSWMLGLTRVLWQALRAEDNTSNKTGRRMPP